MNNFLYLGQLIMINEIDRERVEKNCQKLRSDAKPAHDMRSGIPMFGQVL